MKPSKEQMKSYQIITQIGIEARAGDQSVDLPKNSSILSINIGKAGLGPLFLSVLHAHSEEERRQIKINVVKAGEPIAYSKQKFYKKFIGSVIGINGITYYVFQVEIPYGNEVGYEFWKE